MVQKVVIAGAGVGGLTTAIALQQKGIDFEIYEAFETFRPVGAGILLANNAMQVYQKLGLNEQLTKAGHKIDIFKITDQKLKTISAIAQPPINGIHPIGIHRGKLQQILLDQIPSEKLHLNKKVRSLTNTYPEIILQFEDDSTHTGQCLIGADGIHSIIRNQIFSNSKIRDARQLCCRGILSYRLPAQHLNEGNEMWGKGKRFGMVQISGDMVYWYAVMNSEKDKSITKNDLLSRFQSFTPLVNVLIENTAEDQLLFNRMADLQPIPQWFKDDICLLGDAAHATTPNMGQGAGQAIEDALVLANSLALESNLTKAFTRYQGLRKKKAERVVNTSWKIGKLSHQKNGLIIGLRNKLMRITPKSLTKKQNAFLYEVAE